MQVSPFLVDVVMLLAAAVVVVLGLAAAVQVTRRRLSAAAGLAAAAALLVTVYVGVDAGVGLASRPPQLRPGDTKCFDDWCVSMTGAHRDPVEGTLLVDVRVENRGRGRPMRSNLARAYLEAPGRQHVAPSNGQALRALVEAGQGVDIQLLFPAPRSLQDTRFVVEEGSDGLGPGTFEISGEGSLFHARAGWPLAALA